MDEKIAQVDREVVAGILHAIDEGKPFVTYGDLAKDIEARTGRRVNAHVGFDRPLERIQGYCKACDAPNLPLSLSIKKDIRGRALSHAIGICIPMMIGTMIVFSRKSSARAFFSRIGPG